MASPQIARFAFGVNGGTPRARSDLNVTGSKESKTVQPSDHTPCEITAFVGRHTYQDGSAAPSYVITDIGWGGHHYLVRATYLRRLITDKELKKQIKAGGNAPRAK